MPAIFTDRIARTYMRIMLRAAVIGLLVLQTACDDEPPISMDPVTDIPYEVETAGSVDPIAADGALKGGTFTIWGGPNPKSLNVWVDNWHLSGEVMGLLYESLVTLHSADNKPVGQLASRWEEAPDGVTFTFHIHPDANWSDGQPVTAEDVQFFYDTIMNKDHLTTVYRTVIGRFERPEVIDAKTVRITAKERYWKAFWDAGGFTAFPKHVWEGKDFNRINFDFPVVSGPYELLEYRRNRYVLLKRRADWWGRVLRYNQHKYNFDYIRYRFQEDRTAALETFKKGDYDMYAIYTASIWAQQTDAGALESVARNHVLRQEIFNQEPIGFQGLAINMRQERFQDVRVRQALFYLLDREKLNEQFMFDQYFLLNSYFPDLYPGNKNPAAEMYRYNPEKAGQLLDAAGWQVGDDGWRRKDGQVFSITFITYASDIRHMNKYVEWLKDAGIQARIEQLSKAEVTRKTDNHQFDMFWIATGAGRLRDPEPMFYSEYADLEATSNLSGVKDEQVDAILEQLRKEESLNRRNQLLRQMDARLTELVPYVLLWQSDKTRLLYWNRFGTPRYVLDKYNREDVALVYWWLDAERDVQLKEAMESGAALPEAPDTVRYGGP